MRFEVKNLNIGKAETRLLRSVFNAENSRRRLATHFLVGAFLLLLCLTFAHAQISNIRQTNLSSKNTLRITYGDLTGDEKEEAVILLRRKEKRNRSYDEILVYSLKNGKPSKLAQFNAGRRGDYVLSVQSLGSNFKIEDKIFVLDLAVWREGEYVPTQYYTIKYRWNGFQIQETERSCLKPLPENMREIG